MRKVIRLYQSSDPLQYVIFHGNICARDERGFNGYGAPCTHPVVNGPLGVGFIGTSRFKPKYLGNTYKICKSKVWGFLHWLKVHNRLYKGVSLDEQRTDLYPDSDYLPGVEVEESIIHDNRADPDDMLHYYIQGDRRNI